jgi:reactive intermediate/imine deaminase
MKSIFSLSLLKRFQTMQSINTPGMPPANGHYSPCIEHNGMLFLSGQIPFDKHTGKIPEGIEAQALLVLEKLGRILQEAGSDRNHVIQVRIYLSDIGLWDKVNAVYSEFFGTHRPVRCVVPTGPLHYGCLIEAEAVACKPD